MKKAHRNILLLLAFIMMFTLAACSSGDGSDEPVEISATLPPSPPPPTPIPTRDVPISRPTMTPIPTKESPVIAAYVESAPPNVWLKWYPPTGWQTAVGPDGSIISPDLVNPNMMYTTIRLWNDPVPVDAWQSYLPQAEIEPNSHVTLQMGGYEWDGLFVVCPAFTCRAMFAVTSGENAPALSMLVYIPTTVDLTSEADPQATLLGIWDTEAEKLNTTLQTLTLTFPPT